MAEIREGLIFCGFLSNLTFPEKIKQAMKASRFMENWKPFEFLIDMKIT